MSKNSKRTVLIIEDDEIILRTLYLALHKAKCTIVTANDGEEALRITERIKPDLVLLDLLLPKISGLAYLRNLRANPVLKDISVVVLSNLNDEESVNKSSELGVKAFLIKSEIDLSSLVKMVTELLSK